jgi:dihydroorotate dehydrogenase
MFRYPGAQALINRMGFNNDGAVAIAERLNRWRATAGRETPLFVNVGKNRDVPLDAAPDAYAACWSMLEKYADVGVLNLSSPNTPSLRELQKPEHLAAILRAVGSGKPIMVKIAPDLEDELLGEICDVCTSSASGMICTNTTTDRPDGMNEAGGLSGRPLMEKSTRVLARVRERVGQDFPLIGVGGVFTAADVRAKLSAGADLVQVYTGFVYEGPMLAARLARELAAPEPRL